MKIETLAVHAGRTPDEATGAVTLPIHLSTTFERREDGSYPHGFVYSRPGNPNRETLERCLTILEGGSAAAAFSSGSAATMSLLQCLTPGDHVIAPRDVYHGTTVLLRELFAGWGLLSTFVDMEEPANVERALEPRTRLVWVETPSNPLLRISDISRIAAIAHSAGALCACDNTWATPVLQRPLDLGADLVMHATTKYLGGHSDVLGGAIVAREEGEIFSKLRRTQGTGGAVPSPFECWLVQRGIRTLPLRVRAQSESALALARFLAAHRAVEAVHYPGLETHPGHMVAARQMSSFGGMLSFQVTGGRDRAMAVAAKVRLFTRATSLGGVESLIEHRASIEPPGTATPENLLRISVGLEHVDDLIEDIGRALA